MWTVACCSVPKTHRVFFWLDEKERERNIEQTQICSISLVTYHMTYMASTTAWLMVSNHFPISCRLCECQSLCLLDAILHSHWDGTCKNLNKFTILHEIIMGLEPIDSASKRASGTIVFVRVHVCKSSYTENPIHCQWHTFYFLCILAPHQYSLSPAFPHPVHVTSCITYNTSISETIPLECRATNFVTFRS